LAGDDDEPVDTVTGEGAAVTGAAGAVLAGAVAGG
jgi:hypothetical protein